MELKFGCEVERISYDEDGPYVVISESSICNRHKRRMMSATTHLENAMCRTACGLRI
jgi:hypothetical protein